MAHSVLQSNSAGARSYVAQKSRRDGADDTEVDRYWVEWIGVGVVGGLWAWYTWFFAFECECSQTFRQSKADGFQYISQLIRYLVGAKLMSSKYETLLPFLPPRPTWSDQESPRIPQFILLIVCRGPGNGKCSGKSTRWGLGNAEQDPSSICWCAAVQLSVTDGDVQSEPFLLCRWEMLTSRTCYLQGLFNVCFLPKPAEVLMIAASIMIRVVIASGQFMAEVPTNEQGYPSSTVSQYTLEWLNWSQLGGYDWTWEEKQRCISICTDALYQIVSHHHPIKYQADIKGWGKQSTMSNEWRGNTDK